MNMLLQRARGIGNWTVTSRTEHWPNYFFFIFLLLITSIALSIRIDDLGYVTESLWAEDGHVLINQSHELGLQSLWTPHTGYLYLYARVVALLARPVPLAAIPYVFFFAWIISFVIILCILKSRAKSAGLNEFTIAFLVCAIALQPNHGESLFNLNNTNYTLGIALALHVCIPTQKRDSAPTILFLIVASLSGPFSAALTTVLALQLAAFRDFSSRRTTYIIISVCGLIQSIFLAQSQRLPEDSINQSVADWIDAISSFLLFGKINKLSCAASVILWVVILLFLFKWLAEKIRTPDRVLCLTPLFSIATAFLLFFAVASGTLELTTLSPINMGSRYFLIPYSLVFCTALICTRDHRTAQMVVIASLSIICGAGFLTVDRVGREASLGLLTHENLQWTAFTKFRVIRTNLVIPINPSHPVYPPLWQVGFKEPTAGGGAIADITKPIVLIPQNGMSSQVTGLETETSQTLYFDMENHCATSRYLALEIDIWRSRMGWAALHWGEPGNFDSKQSLKRFYPAGASMMQFAFRRDISDRWLKLNPVMGIADSAVVRELHVWENLFHLSGFGVTVPEPTEPGGEVKIKEARLFCLQ